MVLFNGENFVLNINIIKLNHENIKFNNVPILFVPNHMCEQDLRT